MLLGKMMCWISWYVFSFCLFQGHVKPTGSYKPYWPCGTLRKIRQKVSNYSLSSWSWNKMRMLVAKFMASIFLFMASFFMMLAIFSGKSWHCFFSVHFWWPTRFSNVGYNCMLCIPRLGPWRIFVVVKKSDSRPLVPMSRGEDYLYY